LMRKLNQATLPVTDEPKTADSDTAQE